jgi:hypothetical protein
VAMATPASAAVSADSTTAKAGAVRFTAGQPAARTADTVHPDSGWLGQCYPALGSNWGGGWCDGNGPDWHYYGWVDCTNGHEYYGVDRWAGDRRGSYAYCPAGTGAVRGGVDAYHV